MLSVSDCVVLTSIRRGLNPLVNYPCIPGHEIGGTVLATGDMAGAIKPGDRVVVLPCTECGVCSSCLSGRPNACKNNQTLGVQRQGDGATTDDACT